MNANFLCKRHGMDLWNSLFFHCNDQISSYPPSGNVVRRLSDWMAVSGRKGPCRQMTSGLLITELLASMLPCHWKQKLEWRLQSLNATWKSLLRTDLRRRMYTHGSRIWFQVAMRTTRSIWVYDVWSSPWSCRLKMMPVIWGTNHDALNISHKTDTTACGSKQKEIIFQYAQLFINLELNLKKKKKMQLIIIHTHRCICIFYWKSYIT